MQQDKKWLKKNFEKFLSSPISEEVKAYELTEKMVLVDMYAIEPPQKSSLVGLDTMAKEDLGFRWTSIGRVVASGSSLYKAGDIIKVPDFKVALFENPKYGEWEGFGNKGGNVQKIGEAPPKYVTNFYSSFMRYVFVLSPVLNEKDDLRLFLIPEFEIVAKIKDPSLFIKNVEE